MFLFDFLPLQMMYNLLFMLSFWLIRMTVWLFLGRLRELEIEVIILMGQNGTMGILIRIIQIGYY